MRKSSPHSSRDKKPGAGSSFKKEEGRKPFNKDSKPFKKNYDGRGPAPGGSSDRPSRSGAPYSGRTADSDRPKRSFDKPFGKDSRSGGKDGERKPFSDRPKRSFDKPSFKKDDREGGDRKPRREFDKPERRDDDRPKRSFDKPAFRKDDNRDNTDRKPRREFDKPERRDDDRPKRSFDKPAFRKDDNRDNTDRKPRREFDKPERSDDDRPKRSFDKPAFRKDDDRDNTARKPRREFDKTEKRDDDRPKRSFDKPAFRKDDRKESTDRKPHSESDRSDKPAGDSRPFRDRPKKAFDKAAPGKDTGKRGKKGDDEKRTFGNVLNDAFNQPKSKNMPANPEDEFRKPAQFEDKVFGELEDPIEEEVPKRPFSKKPNPNSTPGKKKFIHDHSEGRKKKYKDEDDEDEDDKEISQKDGPRLEMPLNKFIAHSGECSRRDAAELVKQGKVKVNGELVLDPGYRVQHDDMVTMSGKKLVPQKGFVYILLNKPKGFITTNDDPQGRRTVMELVGNSGVDRLFPVGRLDRATTGLLLITNDGDLTQKLSHPAYNIKKVYHVTLDKPLTKADFEKVIAGVELEDGKAIVDEIAYLESKNEVGLEIHSGKNRIVRRIFESLGYVVEKLDRVMYAGLTKKNLPRSKWRYLDEREIVLLKHFKN